MRQSWPTATPNSQGGFNESELSAVIPDLTSCIFARSIAARSWQAFVVEYYYKAKWGYADEFLQLFKKNHYPLLKKEVEMDQFSRFGWTSRATTPPKTDAGITRDHRVQEFDLSE